MATGYDASISYDATKSYDGVRSGFASYIISVDWDNDGDFTDANSNVTDNVLSVKTTQGRAELRKQLETKRWRRCVHDACPKVGQA